MPDLTKRWRFEMPEESERLRTLRLRTRLRNDLEFWRRALVSELGGYLGYEMRNDGVYELVRTA